eukprot:448606-Rhodomonas_salina.1
MVHSMADAQVRTSDAGHRSVQQRPGCIHPLFGYVLSPARCLACRFCAALSLLPLPSLPSFPALPLSLLSLLPMLRAGRLERRGGMTPQLLASLHYRLLLSSEEIEAEFFARAVHSHGLHAKMEHSNCKKATQVLRSRHTIMLSL